MYSIVWTKKAEKGLQKLPRHLTQRIIKSVHALQPDPYRGTDKMELSPDGIPRYKIGIGDYRIILRIEERERVVIVTDVGHRSTTYRKYNG